jgi:hypothetical protein
MISLVSTAVRSNNCAPVRFIDLYFQLYSALDEFSPGILRNKDFTTETYGPTYRDLMKNLSSCGTHPLHSGRLLKLRRDLIIQGR